jgi:hypothetical protein
MAPAQEGRQSPDPEHSTGDQQNKPPAQNPNQGAAPSADFAKDKSKQTLDKLPSNPEHILEKHAEETTSKQ